MVDIVTGQMPDAIDDGNSDRHAAGGLKGGPARAAKLTSEQRSEIARVAASARWKRSRLLTRAALCYVVFKVKDKLDCWLS